MVWLRGLVLPLVLHVGVFWKMKKLTVLELFGFDELLFAALVEGAVCWKLHPLQLFTFAMKTFRCQLKMSV